MSKLLIKSAYDMLSDVTPLKSDCGNLCDAACCISDGYMLLFPGEKELLKKQDYTFGVTELEGFGKADTALCKGTCNRDFRPLSCRIFPLIPKFADDEISLRLDPRGRSVCPLCNKSILSLDKEFLNAVKKTLIMLSQDDRISRYLKALSNTADKYQVNIP